LNLALLRFWGHIPQSPWEGLRPLHPRFAHPRGLRVCLGFGVNLSLSPLRRGEGRTSPNFPPSLAGKGARGLGRKGHIPQGPLDPRLPTPVGLGFARVLGPTRGGVAKVDNPPPLLNFWGHIPQSPPPGDFAPWTPVLPTPVGLGFARVLGPTRGWGC